MSRRITKPVAKHQDLKYAEIPMLRDGFPEI
jgi:hypothetical protein